ncbi:MAG: rhomboid family intramembrane serine protease [Bacteroidales bacterium]|nr:rhomboid family intramembrane serine protease [Bacteroidales bacterium]
MFGRILENVWGSRKMLIFYTICGLGAALVHMSVNYVQMNKLITLANEFDVSPSYALFNEIVEKYALRTSYYNQIMNFMQEWFYRPDDTSFISQASEYVRLVVNTNLQVPTVGASGAVFGLLIAFAMMFPDVELIFIFLPIPIKAKYLVPVYAIIELVFGVSNFKWDNVAHFAHLGGALFGFLLVRYWKRNQFKIY